MEAPDFNVDTLLVTAHPDDEVMFFTPVLLAAKRCLILCLTDGGFRSREDGELRRREFKDSCKVYDGVEGIVPRIDGVEDTPKAGTWSGRERAIVKVMESKISDLGGKVVNIITFDEGGVSGHVNHCDCCAILRSWFDNLPVKKDGCGGAFEGVTVRLFQLRTVETFMKYTPHFGFPQLTIPYWVHGATDEHIVWTDRGLLVARRGMEAHASQYVWYRRLFVLFSSYVCINVLVERRQGGRNYHNNRGKSVFALFALATLLVLNVVGCGRYPNAIFILLCVNRYFSWLGGELYKRNC